MLTRSIRMAAAILFALSTGSAMAELSAAAARPSGTHSGGSAAQATPNVKIVVIDLTVDQLVVRGARLCTDANDVEAVFLGRNQLTVISSTPGLMILAFDRNDITFGVSYVLSILCVDGAEEQFEVYFEIPGGRGPAGADGAAGANGAAGAAGATGAAGAAGAAGVGAVTVETASMMQGIGGLLGGAAALAMRTSTTPVTCPTAGREATGGGVLLNDAARDDVANRVVTISGSYQSAANEWTGQVTNNSPFAAAAAAYTVYVICVAV